MFFPVMSVKVNLLHLTRQAHCVECVTWRVESNSVVRHLLHWCFLLLSFKFQFWMKKHSNFKLQFKWKKVSIQLTFKCALRWNRFTLLVSLPSSPTALVCPLCVSVLTVTTKVEHNLKFWKWTWPCCIVSLPPFDLFKCFVQSRRPAVAFLNKRSLQSNCVRRSLDDVVWYSCHCLLLCLVNVFSATEVTRFNIRQQELPSLGPAGRRPTFLILIYRLRPVCAGLMVY